MKLNLNLNKVVNQFIGKTRKHSPVIMAGAAVIGVVSTAALGIKAGIATERKMVEEANTNGAYKDKQDKFFRVAKVTWKDYLPFVASLGVTVTTIVLMHRNNEKRYAALMGAYVLGEKAYQELRESVDEIEEKKVREGVKERVIQKAVDRDPDAFEEHVAKYGEEHLFYDGFTGRYFTSDIETIRKAENEFNHNLIQHMYGTVNEFYNMIGLDNVAAGEDMGWNSDKLMKVDINPWLTRNNTPAIYIGFDSNPPKFNYYDN